MANEEHLAILRQGVRAWDAWREEHPDVKPDLSRADLSGANLSGADLSGAASGEARGVRTSRVGYKYAKARSTAC